MYLLAVCIPTYKRCGTLRRCVDSVARQVLMYGLQEEVGIYVADDASPDDTPGVIGEFGQFDFFSAVTRQQNLGMNQNIKHMLQEASTISQYQLILTDDDYLKADTLQEIINFLKLRVSENSQTAAVWTPRYSYTEDGRLHSILCNPYDHDQQVSPSVANAGRYMGCGFVLSGLILRSEQIDYEFWDDYRENAYFPVIFFGDYLLGRGAYYWNRDIVHHTVLNECHWERWGRSDVMISLRLFSDFVNAYAILADRLDSSINKITFYLASFPAISGIVNGPLVSDPLKSDPMLINDARNELVAKGLLNFNLQLRMMMVLAAVANFLVGLAKCVVFQFLAIFPIKGRDEFRRRGGLSFEVLRNFPTRMKLILS